MGKDDSWMNCINQNNPYNRSTKKNVKGAKNSGNASKGKVTSMKQMNRRTQ